MLIPCLGVSGLAIAAVQAARNDWLGAAAVTGTTGLLVSPISWTHHWVWILPAARGAVARWNPRADTGESDRPADLVVTSQI
jgi:hypothetical protein